MIIFPFADKFYGIPQLNIYKAKCAQRAKNVQVHFKPLLVMLLG
jgi:hypothetical protein